MRSFFTFFGALSAFAVLGVTAQADPACIVSSPEAWMSKKIQYALYS